MKKIRVGRIGIVALINACTAFILLIAFAPHLIPFFRTEPQRFLLPVVSAESIVSEDPKKEVISGTPVRIIVPSVTVDVEIADGLYDEKAQTWTLEDKRAHYAVMTAPANDTAGNTFVYGHNSKAVFGRLLKAEVGAEAVVETDNGKRFTYRLTSFTDVKPDAVSVLQHTEKPVLTVQTCSGSWFQNRRILTFEFVRVEEIKP